MTDDIGALAFAAGVALAAAAGILLIEDDTLRVVFLVCVCAVALGASLLRPARSAGGEGADFLVPVIAAILVSSIAFDDDQAKLASIVVLTLLFSVGWRALRSRRGRRLA